MHRALVAVVLLLPSIALAQPRPDARRLSCAQASSLVRSSGAVVMSTGAYTYDRFVSGGGQCALGEITRPTWTATTDQAQCFVGYVCVERNFQSTR